MTGFKKAKRIIPIFIISFILIIPIITLLPSPAKADFGTFFVDYPDSNSTFWGSFRSPSYYPAPNAFATISGFGNWIGNFNPNNVNYNLRSYMVTSHFNTSGHPWYGGFDPDLPFHEPVIASIDANVISVFAMIRSWDRMNEGWFSIRYNETVSWSGATPWSPNSANYYESSGANYNSHGWSNSSLYPFKLHTSNNNWVMNEWNITSLYNWNVSMLTTCQYPDTSAGINIMWTTNENSSLMRYDYLGIRFICYGNYELVNPLPPELPEQVFSTNFSGLMWLLIIFIPAIAMGQYIPKIGFAAGIILMIIIVGAIYITFIPYTIMGIIAVAIMIYKGD